MTCLTLGLSINDCHSGGQDHVLPVPAEELKQRIMAGQAPGTQPDVMMKPLPPAPQPLTDDRELFSSERWRAALDAAGMASSLCLFIIRHMHMHLQIPKSSSLGKTGCEDLKLDTVCCNSVDRVLRAKNVLCGLYKLLLVMRRSPCRCNCAWFLLP